MNDISWTICKGAPRSTRITTPAPHHPNVYGPDALPDAKPTVSKLNWPSFPAARFSSCSIKHCMRHNGCYRLYNIHKISPLACCKPVTSTLDFDNLCRNFNEKYSRDQIAHKAVQNQRSTITAAYQPNTKSIIV